MRSHYEGAVAQREHEAALTMSKLSELQSELEQKENDLTAQKQRTELRFKCDMRAQSGFVGGAIFI